MNLENWEAKIMKYYYSFKFILFALFLGLFLLGGCSKKQEINNNQIIFWSSSLKPYFTDYIQKVIKNFEDLYGVKVQWQDYPIDSIYQKILTSYRSEVSPDVINVNPQLAAGLYKQELIIHFDETIEKNYYPNLIEGCKINGKLITIPWYSSTKMLVYNKEIFDFSKHSINNYREFFKLLKIIKDSKGVYAFYPFIKFEQDMLGLSLIENPKNPFSNQVMEFFDILRKNREYLPSGFWVSSVEVAYSMYKDKKVASILIGPQFLFRIKKEDPKLYSVTDVSLFPFSNYPVTLMSLCIVNNKDNLRIQNSIKFIKFLTNFENQNEFFKLVPVLPSVKGNYDTSDNDSLISKVKKEMVKIFPYSKVFDLYFYEFIPDPVQRSNIFKNFLNDVFNSNLSIEQIKEKYELIWRESIKK